MSLLFFKYFSRTTTDPLCRSLLYPYHIHFLEYYTTYFLYSSCTHFSFLPFASRYYEKYFPRLKNFPYSISPPFKEKINAIAIPPNLAYFLFFISRNVFYMSSSLMSFTSSLLLLHTPPYFKRLNSASLSSLKFQR